MAFYRSDDWNPIDAIVQRNDRKRDTNRQNESLSDSVAFDRQRHQCRALLNDTIIDTIVKTRRRNRRLVGWRGLLTGVGAAGMLAGVS